MIISKVTRLALRGFNLDRVNEPQRCNCERSGLPKPSHSFLSDIREKIKRQSASRLDVTPETEQNI